MPAIVKMTPYATSIAIAAVIFGGIPAAGSVQIRSEKAQTLALEGADAFGPFEPFFFTGDLRDLPKVELW